MKKPVPYQDFGLIEEKLGHSFKNRQLLKEALTHKSAGDGKAGFDHNERLEWLGDRVLGILCAQYLFSHFPNAEEGVLTKKFNAIVNGHNCAKATNLLGLEKYIITSKSIGPNDNARPSINGDAYEAIMGALYLDGGLNACIKLFEAAIETSKTADNNNQNFKSRLQELAQKNGYEIPIYKIIDRKGKDHEPDFLVEVYVGDHFANAWGSSKQNAEQAAAKALLNHISNTQEFYDRDR